MSCPHPRNSLRVRVAAVAFLLGLWAAPGPARAQFGLAAAGVGPINRSMGGAATAAPLDAAGALYWNPATIGALEQSEMEFGNAIAIPRATLSSRLPAGSLGMGLPANSMAGNTGSNSGVFLAPAVGIVYNPTDSPWTYGLGIFAIGGFAVNYPASRTNPILSPQFPFGTGVGPLFTQLQLAQFTPTVSLKVTERLYLGASATIDVGNLSTNPASFHAPHPGAGAGQDRQPHSRRGVPLRHPGPRPRRRRVPARPLLRDQRRLERRRLVQEHPVVRHVYI